MLSSCGSGGDGDPAPATAVAGELTVFAAASLQVPFREIEERFETENPGTDVIFDFAGSADLVARLSQGAPADVFASADTANMTGAVDAGLVAGEPVNFAANTLTIVTEPGNPEDVRTFADLTRPGLDVVVCAPQVPCGAATARIEDAAGVALEPVSEESSVTDVLGKVATGQADAGLVYVTDALRAGDDVTAVPFPESAAAVNTYPVAVLADGANPATAAAFLAYVTGPEGRRILAEKGFAAP
ncbi:molybdate ABC transporter substrate-binding protein [Rhodococcus sp. 14C212]|nr:molybdate ABC transporter substrate-binding protein [Rhodococcus sp. 14C212]NGP05586.1 molybdate ABC transporter substrate-binding protein [Rhodococcus sp. 14C212]